MRKWPAVIIASTVAIGALLAILAPAFGRDLGQWENTDPVLRQWYRSLMQPDNPGVSCCGEGDAYFADKVEVKDGKVYATITDTRADEPLGRRHIPPGTRFEIPHYKLKWDRGNPVGRAIIFVNTVDQVLCFVQATGT